MKRGTPDHPKVAMLAAKLDVPLYSAVGILEMLWHFTAEFCPRGNVGKFPDKSICAGIKWGKSRINLILVLLECGFLEPHTEHRLIVHDWEDHADQAVRRKLERAKEEFVTSQRLVAVKPLTSTSLPLPKPLPLPEPTPEPEAADAADPPKPKKPPTETELLIEDIAEELSAEHPKLRSCVASVAATRLKSIAKLFPPIDRIPELKEIRRRHHGWCESNDWMKNGGQYAKGLKAWLSPTDQEWRKEPPDQTFALTATNGTRPPQSLTFAERNEEIRNRKFMERMEQDLLNG